MYYIGIDIGSISVDTAVLDENKKIIEDQYIRTDGKPLQTTIKAIEHILTRYPKNKIAGIITTGVIGKLAAQYLNGMFVNEVIAQTKATSYLYPQINTIIEMGGQDSKLIILDQDKNSGNSGFKDFAMNSACAAGTGSFLDQQASRMGYSIEEFSQLALKSETPPRIAGRCSVFAKSDMIHLQQIATPDYDIIAGLCYAVARNFKSSISRGKKFVKPIAFQGGVAANHGVIKAFKDILHLTDDELIIPKKFGTMGAIGAALHLIDNQKHIIEITLDKFITFVNSGENKVVGEKKLNLLMEKNKYGNRSLTQKYIFPKNKKVQGYLGIDVGSLSTNVVVIDKDKKVIAKRYLMTAGRPIEAVRKGINEIGKEIGQKINIIGAGTTGSGRYLTGDFIGADVVRNEITAQARAAIHLDSSVDTIFEIGGQDSKYISIENGVVVDFEMNKVCAAGTGSFLEEQAEKLGINIKEEFGDLALSCKSGCKLGERCTVFMESDVVTQQQAGATTSELVSGLSYSIVHNYLNRVVGDRKIGDNIFFQGGTAANLGVVAAFEEVTGKKIIVPPYHDVTGAIGAAILAMETMKPDQQTKFKGFDLSQRKYSVETFVCQQCDNHCEVRKVTIENEKPLFYGHRCELYEINREKSAKRKNLPDLFGEREKFLLDNHQAPQEKSGRKRIGFPRALSGFHQLFPFFNGFFRELDMDIVLSDSSNSKVIHEGVAILTAETCFPVKVAHGHVINVLKKQVDYVFLPHVITMEKTNENFDQAFNCPYVQAFPDMIGAAINLAEHRVLRPVINFRNGRDFVEKELLNLGTELEVEKEKVKEAFKVAEKAQKDFQEKLIERGKEILASYDEKILVLVSRSYNGCDSGVNMGLPDKINDQGVLLMPMDFLPLDNEDITQFHHNMYWFYGQKILAAAEFIRKNKNLFALYLTNFACGPDSFITHFFRERMRGKPYLQLEIDEHSADAGVVTRCEAFLDSLEHYQQKESTPLWHANEKKVDLQGRTVYIPNISDHSHAFASAFRAFGVDAQPLPESDEETLKWGLKYTSGKECYPCLTTTGDVVKLMKQENFDPNKSAFFMPLSDGPCRFGQYSLLQRLVLDQFGYEDMPIVSPSSKDSYSVFPTLDNSFQRLGWKALLATDILIKLKRETRPYEVHKGETNKVYAQCLNGLSKVTEMRGDILHHLTLCKERFKNIITDKSMQKPIIGIVGEIYVRSNRFSNDYVVEKVEALGGEAWVAPFCEWILYSNITSREKALLNGDIKEIMKLWFKDKYQRLYDRTYHGVFKDILKAYQEPPVDKVIKYAEGYISRATSGGETILTIAKGIDYIEQGLSGVINVMPFTCMPGTIVSAISKKIRDDYHNVPWLNIAYDANTKDNSTVMTQLEAFIHQAREYQKRIKK